MILTEKQYEAFRLECAGREGWVYDPICDNWKRGLDNGRPHPFNFECAFTNGSMHFQQLPTYADHDSLQRIIDGLDYSDTEFYIGSLMLDDCHKLIKATVEQKQAALCAVFGLEGK